MISYALFDSPVVKQGVIGQEFYLLGHPQQTQNLHRLVSHLSSDPTIVIMNAFSVGPTVISRPRVEVVSGTLPKSDRAVRALDRRRTASSHHWQWPCSGLADIRSYCILFLGYAKRWVNG
jgi:hypothetical protein